MYLRYVLTAAAIFCLAGVAKADYSIEFATSSGVAASSFTGNSGTSLTIQVYLLQNSGGTGSQTLTTVGLSTANLGLSYTSGAFLVTSASPNSSQFTYTSSGNINNSSSSATVSEVASSPVIAPTTGSNAQRILLGQFTLTLNSSGSITSYFPSGGSNDVNGSGTTLDSLITQSTASVYVVSVPEPSTMILTGLAGTIIGVGAWRRRRKSLATQVA